MIGATSVRISAEIARQSSLARDIARGQTDVSSEKRLQVASDDPAASARVAEIRRTQANQAAWKTNIDTGAAIAARVDSTLEGTATNLDRARELLIQAKSSTTGVDGRAAIASELASIADDIANAANSTDSRGRALFPAGEPLKLPIGDGVATAATLSKADAFGSMESILRAAAAAVSAGDATAVQAGLDGVTASSSTLATVRAEQGVRASRFDAARETIESSGIDLTEERGLLEGTDLTATAAALQSKLLTLSAAQAIFARVNAKSLFDLL